MGCWLDRPEEFEVHSPDYDGLSLSVEVFRGGVGGTQFLGSQNAGRALLSVQNKKKESGLYGRFLSRSQVYYAAMDTLMRFMAEFSSWRIRSAETL